MTDLSMREEIYIENFRKIQWKITSLSACLENRLIKIENNL